jgi:gluconate 5-dehydrogenase
MDKSLSFESIEVYKKKSKKKLIALVTGGLGRIGSVFTGNLLYEKNIVIVLSRNSKNYIEYKNKLPINLRHNLNWFCFDFNEPKNLNRVLDIIIKKFKRIDILVNNVCDGKRGEFLNYNLTSLNKELWGTFGTTMLLTEKILPIMRKQKFGKILNVGSIWGIKAPKFKTYLNLNNGPSPLISSSKGALVQYTKHLASREARYNITSNMLVPGFFPRKGRKNNQKYIKTINSNIPMNRIGKLEDLICAVDFLLSNDNSYFTGQLVIVDGGYTVW